MEALPAKGDKLESKIQEDIIKMLMVKGWYVMPTHGNMYQRGFPDLWVSHSRYGPRWVEVKRPTGYKFTPAQLECFPKICANGSDIWILVAATELEYKKIFRKGNWYTYLSVFK